MALRPYTDEEWDDLPHIFLTHKSEWDPSILDHEHEDEHWFDAVIDLERDPTLNLFDEFGTYRHRVIVQNAASCPSPSLFEPYAQVTSPKDNTWHKYTSKPRDIPIVTWLTCGPRRPRTTRETIADLVCCGRLDHPPDSPEEKGYCYTVFSMVTSAWTASSTAGLMGYLDRPPEDGEHTDKQQYMFYEEEERELFWQDFADDTQELESSSIGRGVTNFHKEFVDQIIAPVIPWINSPTNMVPISMTPLEYRKIIETCTLIPYSRYLEGLRRHLDPVLKFTPDVSILMSTGTQTNDDLPRRNRYSFYKTMGPRRRLFSADMLTPLFCKQEESIHF